MHLIKSHLCFKSHPTQRAVDMWESPRPDIGMSKEEYLDEKRVLDEQIRSTQEDIERITKELKKAPFEADLQTLEEMVGKIVQSLGMNLDMPDTEKHRILELLNVKLIISPEKEVNDYRLKVDSFEGRMKFD